MTRLRPLGKSTRTEVVGCSMLAKCSNPSCSTPFRYLKGGNLFRLEGDAAFRKGEFSQVEYFWLCDSCSSTMTLRLSEDEVVVAVPLPKQIRGVTRSVTPIVDRKRWIVTPQYELSLSQSKVGIA